MTTIAQILLLILTIAQYVIFAQIILSLLTAFDILNLRQPIVYQIWQGLERLTAPLYRPIRQVLPDTGTLDFAPLVVLIAIYALKIVIVNNLLAPGFA